VVRKHFWQTSSPFPMYAFLMLTVLFFVCAGVDFMELRLGLALIGAISGFVFIFLATLYRPEPPPPDTVLDAERSSVLMGQSADFPTEEEHKRSGKFK
jgi:hypothetical protein